MLLIFRGTKLVIYFGTANINRCLYGNFVYFFIHFEAMLLVVAWQRMILFV